ncbi:MAG: hypothetical protein Ct9H90mP16_13340 [Candidatus Poseidoniales archaeon]|nr:MAG: hypothetical protein Ct9H90mP16_13340 [Candidatus Poseidoniales archaeon]
MPGNYVAGANIAGFLKVAEAMDAQGFLIFDIPPQKGCTGKREQECNGEANKPDNDVSN